MDARFCEIWPSGGFHRPARTITIRIIIFLSMFAVLGALVVAGTNAAVAVFVVVALANAAVTVGQALTAEDA